VENDWHCKPLISQCLRGGSPHYTISATGSSVMPLEDRALPLTGGPTAQLRGKSDPKASRPFSERNFATLENVAHHSSHPALFEAARFISDRGEPSAGVGTHPRNDYLVGVRVDNEIGVVGDHDDLALAFRRLEQGTSSS
jgi:hypothetical protein